MTAKGRNILRTALIVVAILFIVLGVYRKEVKVVLNKAKAICFACIGLD